ncbi:hybrid sensor histidine kinase/response regulator [Azospirillum soli]|uniref:hybrid sensor histidine kinase/response regulator n=1 Tax=Azospirillum soli TaxID=1304799 RepID=UPI001AE1C01A|nr:hybrid sensor histidine kinase/response regulator [Azospirillum soli]MBP2315261.1 two-component system NtrC family sensor kinase [Azospirillum soli]
MPHRSLVSSADGPPGSLRLLRLLLAASVVVPLSLFAAIAWRDYLEVQADAERNIRKTVLILHEHVQKVFDTVEQALDRVDERSRGMGWEEIPSSESLHRYMKTLSDELPQVGSLALVDPQGFVQIVSRVFPLEPLYVADREYFRAQRERDHGFHVGEALVNRRTGRPQFNVSRRRTSPGGPDGVFAGTLVASIRTDYFVEFYRQVAQGENEAISILREDGMVLARYPALESGTPLRLGPDAVFMRAVAEGRQDGVHRGQSHVDGIERIFGYKRVAPYPVYVSYGVAQSDITAAWLRNMMMYAAFALPATLALAVMSWLAMRRARRETDAVRRWAEEVRNREQLEIALRQAQKLEALGQLTGGVAHDFNNLLTAALTNLHLMSRHLPQEAARHLDGANAALDRAKKLTGQLLAFSRQEAVNPTVVDLGDSLRGMANLLERSIRADIALDWDLAPLPMAVEVDPVQLEMVVLNLVINARDAMPGGGRIRISARPAGDSPTGGVVMLEVADTGQGMPPEVQARAFEPFFTTKSDGKGTGLGLSMVYGFARQSGGNAEIESTPGRGTLIRIALPATTKRPVAEPAAPEAARGGPEHVRVLVVEDNALVLMATVEGLAQEGFDVLTADHGAEALEVLERESGIDVVVSDVVMPYGVSGIDLARRVHERWPHIRVLLISGYSPESLTGLGADTAVLPKPFTPDQLAGRIRTLLASAQAV